MRCAALQRIQIYFESPLIAAGGGELWSLAAAALLTALRLPPSTIAMTLLAGLLFLFLALLPVLTQAKPDPTCSLGIRHPDSQCCCAASCGTCGGSSCQNFKGGRTECCCGAIAEEGRSCSVEGAPCIVGPPVPTTSVANPKRGFVADGAKSCDTPLLLNVSGWYYDYNVGNPCPCRREGYLISLTSTHPLSLPLTPDRKDGLAGDCTRANASADLDLRFSPMNWCLSSLKADVPDYVNRSFL